MADEETFLSRWSRRKLEERAEEPAMPAESEAPAAEAREPGEPGAPSAEPDAAPSESERHPTEDIDIDALTRESDFTVFMAKGVPRHVKQRALRKLWTTDPVLAGLDGLNDYDVNVAVMNRAHGFGPIRGTSWQLGKGFSWLGEIAEAEPGNEEGAPREETVAAAEAQDEPARIEDPPAPPAGAGQAASGARAEPAEPAEGDEAPDRAPAWPA